MVRDSGSDSGKGKEYDVEDELGSRLLAEMRNLLQNDPINERIKPPLPGETISEITVDERGVGLNYSWEMEGGMMGGGSFMDLDLDKEKAQELVAKAKQLIAPYSKEIGIPDADLQEINYLCVAKFAVFTDITTDPDLH